LIKSTEHFVVLPWELSKSEHPLNNEKCKEGVVDVSRNWECQNKKSNNTIQTQVETHIQVQDRIEISN